MKKRMMAMLMTAILVIASIPFTAFAEETPAEVLGGEVMEAAAEAAEAAEAVEAAEEPAEGTAEGAENAEGSAGLSEITEGTLLAGDSKPNYLTFTANEAESIVTFNYENGTVQYSIDKGETWINYTKGDSITLHNVGDTVSFKGTEVRTAKDKHFSMSGSINASGSVMSLTDSLFDECFKFMFAECEALKTAPELPAETLAKRCYESMFKDCSALKTAPTLPATDLAEYCYLSMFSGCTSLETAPALPSEELATSCYSNMFSGCAALKTAPALPATKLADGCYQSMFKGCSTLETAPTLPATTLAQTCYVQMFQNCVELKTAPTLPAETLVSNCYQSMFNGCSSLNRVSVKFTDWNTEGNATKNWLKEVAENGIFECPAVLVIKYSKDASHFPEGWQQLNEVTVTTWAGLQEAITAAGTTETKICLGNDLSPVGSTPGSDDNKPINIENGAKIILDLNGHTLNRGLSEATSNGSVIIIRSGATFTLMDGKEGGKVTGGYTTGNGGGVCVYGTFTMTGGSIEKNKQPKNEAYNGGGVYVDSGAAFSMTGGSITGNVGGYGGGVRVNGTFTMTGGTIAKNEAVKGGGVYFYGIQEQEFKMTGGSITENITTGNGGGVHINYDKMTVGGKAVITGNFKETDASKTENNVYLPLTATTIAIATEAADKPQDGMKIGVTTGTEPKEGNPVKFTENGTANDKAFFTPDQSGYIVAYNAGGYLELQVSAQKTINEILETAEGGFPTSNTYGGPVPANAWVSKEGGVIYREIDDGAQCRYLYCKGTGYEVSPKLNDKVTPVEGESEEYTHIFGDGINFLFHLDDGKLTKIVVSVTGEDVKKKTLEGTYTPPAAPEPKITITANKSVYEPGETIDLLITTTGIDFSKERIYITDGVNTMAPSIDSTGKGEYHDSSKTAAGTYTYKAYVKEKPDIYDEVTVTVKGNDPKPDPTPSSDDSEPLFTGTWNNPVKNGAWKQDANGVWSYTTTQTFRSTWGYIENPYAKEGQNKADWFFFDQYGHMLTGWQWIMWKGELKCYYLNPSKDGTLGACLLGPGKTPDGWEIDETGAWTGR